MLNGSFHHLFHFHFLIVKNKKLVLFFIYLFESFFFIFICKSNITNMLYSLLTTLTRGFPHIPNAPIGAQQQPQQQQQQQPAIVKP
jgi:hypothetical protein